MTKTDDFLFKLLLATILAGVLLAFSNFGATAKHSVAYNAGTAAEKPRPMAIVRLAS